MRCNVALGDDKNTKRFFLMATNPTEYCNNNYRTATIDIFNLKSFCFGQTAKTVKQDEA